MASILVTYGTGEGQTAKVAARVAEELRDAGHDPTTVDLADGEVDPSGYDAVLVGASIHVGSPQEAVVEFARVHREALQTRPSGFFLVSLSAALEGAESEAEVAGYVEEFVEASGWRPDRVATVGGALRYSEYGFLKRALLKRIAGKTTGDTDTSRDYEYTDWEEVAAFARDFAAFAETRLDAAA